MTVDVLRSLNQGYFIGPVDFGASLQTTGLINFYNSGSLLATSFQAGNATAAVTYTFPTAGPAGNGYLLNSTTAGVMSWSNSIAQSFTFSGLIVNGTILSTDATANAIKAEASANGINPRITARNSNTTAGQTRMALIGAAGDNGSVELSLIAGKDAANANFEMVTGTTKLQLGFGAVAKFTIDASGILNNNVAGNESTGAGSALLGANSPAVTLTAPYTWLKVKTSDGSTGYIPIWK